ncbi:MAG: hypothetical protein B5M53_05705 [Candidatus Cloacimonas sp. 4484_209]|nr:MAG: hypothetical protein B5M53_05705 [Candidatus Cloacimonas sp. 4484_209]
MEKQEAQRELAEIRSMLKETEEEVKQISKSNADYRILWGVCVFFVRIDLMLWVPFEWVLIMGLGWFFSHRLTKRVFRKTGIMTFVGKVEGMVWLSTTVSIILVMLFGISKFFNPTLIPAFIAILIGNAFFIGSFLFSSRISAVFSIFIWIGAVALAINPQLSFQIYMGLVVLTMIVPGIITKLGKE